jgi:HEAT repeat protein
LFWPERRPLLTRPPAAMRREGRGCVQQAEGAIARQSWQPAGSATDEVVRLIARLKALRDADRAVLELIGLGRIAVPELRRFLFQREPSGLYEPRCNAVFALASLHAEDALLDFLKEAPEGEIADPIERTGEDAVINAAARALGHRRDQFCFSVLMRMAEERPMAGVIEALGAMGCDRAIPRLIEGLSSDFARGAAEAALRKFGAKARSSLITAVLTPKPSAEFESVTSLRTRWSAMGLLSDVGVTLEEWSLLKPLMEANNGRLAALACLLALATKQPMMDREEAIGCLIRLLKSTDWLLTMQIESWLVENFDLTIRAINRAVDRGDSAVRDESVRRSLLRVVSGVATANLATLRVDSS